MNRTLPDVRISGSYNNILEIYKEKDHFSILQQYDDASIKRRSQRFLRGNSPYLPEITKPDVRISIASIYKDTFRLVGLHGKSTDGSKLFVRGVATLRWKALISYIAIGNREFNERLFMSEMINGYGKKSNHEVAAADLISKVNLLINTTPDYFANNLKEYYISLFSYYSSCNFDLRAFYDEEVKRAESSSPPSENKYESADLREINIYFRDEKGGLRKVLEWLKEYDINVEHSKSCNIIKNDLALYTVRFYDRDSSLLRTIESDVNDPRKFERDYGRRKRLIYWIDVVPPKPPIETL